MAKNAHWGQTLYLINGAKSFITLALLVKRSIFNEKIVFGFLNWLLLLSIRLYTDKLSCLLHQIVNFDIKIFITLALLFKRTSLSGKLTLVVNNNLLRHVFIQKYLTWLNRLFQGQTLLIIIKKGHFETKILSLWDLLVKLSYISKKVFGGLHVKLLHF